MDYDDVWDSCLSCHGTILTGVCLHIHSAVGSWSCPYDEDPLLYLRPTRRFALTRSIHWEYFRVETAHVPLIEHAET